MLNKVFKFLFHRIVLVALSMLIQIGALVIVIWRFNEYFVYFYAFCVLLSLSVVLWIINSKSNPSYKIAWIVPILLVPIFGGIFFLLFGNNRLSRRERKKMAGIRERVNSALSEEWSIVNIIAAEDQNAANQARYIEKYAGAPVFSNTYTEYLTPGEMKFQRLKEELRKAQHYIFLEYFIIEEGIMWDEILEILVEKVKEGVDVRVIYDDAGCLFTLPYRYDRKLESMGIKCCVFNPFIPVLSFRFNNRDHRKIVVIDGFVGFTGGINLADEYINAYEKHGHWKDASIMLKGAAVWNLTVMFLSVWDFLRKDNTDSNYDAYRPQVYHPEPFPDAGYTQPFCDSPMDDEAVGETVYLNLINKAKRYVYINTPYLIIDNEMVTALTSAAKSGVDVRILTPHIADKWYVHAVTRAYYEVLVESGVKIYEYTPGFVHAKTFAVDDEYGVVGTINLDYRSLYLHYECAVWMYRTRSVYQVRDDFLETLNVCEQITLESCRNVPWYVKAIRAILRAFAPLM